MSLDVLARMEHQAPNRRTQRLHAGFRMVDDGDVLEGEELEAVLGPARPLPASAFGFRLHGRVQPLTEAQRRRKAEREEASRVAQEAWLRNNTPEAIERRALELKRWRERQERLEAEYAERVERRRQEAREAIERAIEAAGGPEAYEALQRREIMRVALSMGAVPSSVRILVGAYDMTAKHREDE